MVTVVMAHHTASPKLEILALVPLGLQDGQRPGIDDHDGAAHGVDDDPPADRMADGALQHLDHDREAQQP